MNPKKTAPLVVNGWTLIAHPLFIEQVEELAVVVEALVKKHPTNYPHKNATKRLAAIIKLAFETIPQDPTRSEYRQGATLGSNYKHWFRAEFFQQYRLFFRYHESSKIIVYGWVNDQGTKRAYESKSDAYGTFARMLDSGHPPNDWDSLLTESKAAGSRLDRLARSVSPKK
jgi:toxin YhaV